MRKIFNLIGFILGGLLVSCATADVLTFDQLKPAEMNFPSEIRQVGIVNNMPQRSRRPASDNLPLGVLKGERKFATEALAGVLADSKYFDQVVICDSALQVSDAYDTTNPILSSEAVQMLSADLGVDMLISFDGLWVETEKKELQFPGWNSLFPAVQARVTPVVRLYLPTKPQPLYTVALADSIIWDLSTQVSEKTVLKETTELAVSKVADFIVPRWEQVERVYFSGGCVEMRDAAVYVREDSWQNAQDTWKALFNRLRKGKIKARAAYNVALSYEMLGDVENAQKWIKEAQKTVAPKSEEEQIVNYYADALTRRMAEVISLKSQMHRFNDNF